MTPSLTTLATVGTAISPVFGHVPVRLRTLKPDLPVMRVHPLGDPSRTEVETFITRLYRSHFDAAVADFAPFIVSLRDRSGTIAAAGYRYATEPLFLERYLPAPVDEMLSTPDPVTHALFSVRPVPRSSIVEVGHLAAARPGAGQLLFQHLAHHLADQGREWVVNTATRSLRALFLRMKFSYVDLGAAEAERAGIDPLAWGRYYAQSPRVIAGRLSENLHRLPAPARQIEQ